MTNFLFMLLVAFLLVVLYETEILTANDIAANRNATAASTTAITREGNR